MTTPPFTAEEIAELRRVVDSASRGIEKQDNGYAPQSRYRYDLWSAKSTRCDGRYTDDPVALQLTEDDANFFVAMGANAGRLLDEIERLEMRARIAEVEAEDLRAAIEKMRDYSDIEVADELSAILDRIDAAASVRVAARESKKLFELRAENARLTKELDALRAENAELMQLSQEALGKLIVAQDELIGREVQRGIGVFSALAARESKASVEAPKPVVCATCNDTHRMARYEGMVPCTGCPAPCSRCCSDGFGPYCKTTPCVCDCHPTRESKGGE